MISFDNEPKRRLEEISIGRRSGLGAGRRDSFAGRHNAYSKKLNRMTLE
jgi:hypothetical protein